MKTVFVGTYFNLLLTLKALGFLLPVQHWGGGGSTPSVKLDPDILESWNFQGWQLMFYKICQFESPTMTNDVIMMSLPKTLAKFAPPRNQTRYISFERYWRAIQNVLFIEFEPLCQTLRAFCQMLALFMIPLTKYGHVMWPKMQISKLFYFVVILHLILGKATKFQVEKLPTSEVINKGAGGKHPSQLSLGLILFLLYKSLCGLFADYLGITFMSLAPILICYCYSNFITLLLLCTARGLLAD